MHWVDRRSAKANVGKALEAIGWKLYGWKRDQSDSMTDYYNPESWRGVAEKCGAVVVVDLRSATEARDLSGQGPVTGHKRGPGPCIHCRGTGKLQRDEPGYSTVELLTGRREVTPAKSAGDPCESCGGTGTREVDLEPLRGEAPWPVFHELQGRCLWHVERGGRIVARGQGLGACAGSSGAALESAARLAARIDRAASGLVEVESELRVDRPTVTLNEERGGVEVRFPEKPAPEVLQALKGAGWRWSRRSGCWYKRRSPEAERFAEELTQAAGVL